MDIQTLGGKERRGDERKGDEGCKGVNGTKGDFFLDTFWGHFLGHFLGHFVLGHYCMFWETFAMGPTKIFQTLALL